MTVGEGKANQLSLLCNYEYNVLNNINVTLESYTFFHDFVNLCRKSVGVISDNLIFYASRNM